MNLDNKTPIIIPLHHGGGKFKNDTELRYALRSIERHFQGAFRIIIVGKKIPEWLVNVEHVYEEGLKSSLIAAANYCPEGFLWWYDDCCLLKNKNSEELKVTTACEGWQKPNTTWTRQLDKIRQRLLDENLPAWDYSRPHGPYWFDKGMVDEGFADWPGMRAKFPWETWILSKRNWPRRYGEVMHYYGEFKHPPSDDCSHLNYSDSGNTPELRRFLEQRFPDPCSFEDIKNLQTQKKENERVLFTCHEGCDPRIWNWCGPGIRHFALQCGAELIELPKCKETNPQWVLFDAMRESLTYPKETRCAWIDSDIVVSNPATDFWSCYPHALHACPSRFGADHPAFPRSFYEQFEIPKSVANVCTGIVMWTHEDAERICDWYDKNKHRIPTSVGDQEVLILALHELKMSWSPFHRKMHVTGGNPPPGTSFKHNGGRAKFRNIPRFLAKNSELGVAPPHENSVVVELVGGLGNQLFGYAEVLHRRKLGQDVGWRFNDQVGLKLDWGLEAMGLESKEGNQGGKLVRGYFQDQTCVDQMGTDILKSLDNIQLSESGRNLSEFVHGKFVTQARYWKHGNDLPEMRIVKPQYEKLGKLLMISNDENRARAEFSPYVDILNTENMDPLEVVVALSHAEQVLWQKNSTFSWWASWLNEKRKNPNRFLSHPGCYGHIPAFPVFRITDRLMGEGVRPSLAVFLPDKDKTRGTILAHIRCLHKVLEVNEYPCVVLEDDASVTDAVEFGLPDSTSDFVLCGLSSYFITENNQAVNMGYTPINAAHTDLQFDCTGMMSMHAIIYNNSNGVQRVLRSMMNALETGNPCDVQLQIDLRDSGTGCQALKTPWFYQEGANKQHTFHARKGNGQGCLDRVPVCEA